MQPTCLQCRGVQRLCPVAGATPRRDRRPVICRADPQDRQQTGEASGEMKLLSTAVPVAAALTLANMTGLQQALQPTADAVAALGLPAAVIKWGHPGNMAVVLGAMGFYGSGYLGYAIRNKGADKDLKKYAREMHPKLAIGMSIFFALGATGGLLSLTTQGKPIFESPHVWTGLGGLTLLGLQGMLSLFFQDDPSARGLHAYLGAFILVLFSIHAFLGLQLGLSI